MANQDVGKDAAVRRALLALCVRYPQVTAVVLFDTVHQVLITHSGTLSSSFLTSRLT